MGVCEKRLDPFNIRKGITLPLREATHQAFRILLMDGSLFLLLILNLL